MRTLRRPHLPDEKHTYCTAHPDMWSAAPNAGTHTSGARQVRRRSGVELARGGQPVLHTKGMPSPPAWNTTQQRPFPVVSGRSVVAMVTRPYRGWADEREYCCAAIRW